MDIETIFLILLFFFCETVVIKEKSDLVGKNCMQYLENAKKITSLQAGKGEEKLVVTDHLSMRFIVISI